MRQCVDCGAISTDKDFIPTTPSKQPELECPDCGDTNIVDFKE